MDKLWSIWLFNLPISNIDTKSSPQKRVTSSHSIWMWFKRKFPFTLKYWLLHLLKQILSSHSDPHILQVVVAPEPKGLSSPLEDESCSVSGELPFKHFVLWTNFHHTEWVSSVCPQEQSNTNCQQYKLGALGHYKILTSWQSSPN